MLLLGEAELDLLPLAPRDEAELAQDAGEVHARPLARSASVPAPARERLLDRLPRLVARQLTALGELVGELLHAVARERDRPDAGKEELLDEIAHGPRLR